MHFLLKSHKDANILFKLDCLSRNQTKHFSTFQLQLLWGQLSQKALEGEGRRATGPWSFSNLEIQTGFLGFHPDAEFEQLNHEDCWLHTLPATWPGLRTLKVGICHLIEGFSATGPPSATSSAFLNQLSSTSFLSSPIFVISFTPHSTTRIGSSVVSCCNLFQEVSSFIHLLQKFYQKYWIWSHSYPKIFVVFLHRL